MICSSWPVPSVATTSAWVSPRVNSAEPCARGRMPTSQSIGRTVCVSRPSMRRPSRRIAPRTISFSRSLNSLQRQRRARRSSANSSAAVCLGRVELVAALLLAASRGRRPRSAARPPRAAAPRSRPCSAGGAGRLHGSLAQVSASSMMAWITGWKFSWPNVTAPSMTSSDSSLASDSTISTPSPVPATTRSSCESRQLVQRRVQHVFAVDIADARAADRADERNARDRQRGRGADHRDDVGIVFQVMAQNGADDLRLVAGNPDEERPDRPVDQPRDQRFLFGRPALALEEAAGDLAGGEGLLLVVDGQREEILARASPISSPRRCTAPWFRHKSRAPRHRPAGRSCRSRARDGARPTSVLYDRH